MKGAKTKVSSPLTCNSTYFPQIYQRTTPWQVPIRIFNILEYLKLLLHAVVAKDVDTAEEMEEDLEVELEVDVA